VTIAWNIPSLPFTLSPSLESAWTIADTRANEPVSAHAHSNIVIAPGAGTKVNLGPAKLKRRVSRPQSPIEPLGNLRPDQTGDLDSPVATRARLSCLRTVSTALVALRV
jgi:hypothetical protein